MLMVPEAMQSCQQSSERVWTFVRIFKMRGEDNGGIRRLRPTEPRGSREPGFRAAAWSAVSSVRPRFQVLGGAQGLFAVGRVETAGRRPPARGGCSCPEPAAASCVDASGAATVYFPVAKDCRLVTASVSPASFSL